jgi:quinol monooxygenase YgiN
MKSKLLILLLIMALTSNSYGNKGTGVNQSKGTAVQENGMMIVARVTLKADKIKAFTDAARDIIEKSNKEPGCKSYQLFQDPYDNTKFVFVEEYKNQAAVDAHFASEYFKAFGPKIADLVAEPAKIKIVTVGKEVNQ